MYFSDKTEDFYHKIAGETVYFINNKFFEIWIRKKLGEYQII